MSKLSVCAAALAVLLGGWAAQASTSLPAEPTNESIQLAQCRNAGCWGEYRYSAPGPGPLGGGTAERMERRARGEKLPPLPSQGQRQRPSPKRGQN